MNGTIGSKTTTTNIDSVRTGSTNQLIDDDPKKSKTKTTDDQSSTTKPIEDKQKSDETPESSPIPSSPTDSETPSCGGLCSDITARVVVWYIGVSILFIIAFLSLVLSVLYYINDSSGEQVIKIYGIAGASCLAVIAFLIVCLDCCYDGRLTDHEEEAVYKVLVEKETRRERERRRRERRKYKMMLEQLKKNQNRPGFSSVPHPQPHAHPYFHVHPHHHFVHHLQPSRAHQPQYFCPICHKSHASTETRHNATDIGVDTSDKFEPVNKRTRTTIATTTQEVQTAPVVVDVEHGTQTGRAEGTQTASTAELTGIPSNVTEIIHETTILKAPRALIATLKKTMEQQDKQKAISASIADGHNTTVETL